jgi:transposase InsO family protein
VQRLLRAAKERGFKDATRGNVKKFLEGQELYGMTRPSRKKFPRSSVDPVGLDSQWEADLMDLNLLGKYNDGYKYVLVVEDIFSRFAWTSKLKSKTGEETARAMKDIFDGGRQPKHIARTDKGREFRNRTFGKLLSDRGIHQLLTYNEVQSGHCERLIKTLKTKMFRYMMNKQTHRWINVLDDITAAYNAAKHRSLGMAPIEVTPENESETRYRQYLIKSKIKNPVKKEKKVSVKPKRKARKKKPKFKVGALVRVSELRSAFKREYDSKWTGELFRITKAYMRDENTDIYQIEDYAGEAITGTFYRQELVPAREPVDDEYKVEKVLKKRKGGREVYVKFLHWPNKYNLWISAKNVRDLGK